MADHQHAILSPQPVPYTYSESGDYPLHTTNTAEQFRAGRTPSPTPSEVEAGSAGLINWDKYKNWRFWVRKAWIPWYILGAVLFVALVLISVFNEQIVHWLTPAGKWMKDLKFGWLIPIAILFVLSFPPLFGHEIVAILVGFIWGLGIGFAIVAAGTFLGEIANYYAFGYWCKARGEKTEKSSILYGCLARVVREGGFKVALIVRLSVIPPHFSTAVFSACGMKIWIFTLAAFFSLPKQLLNVYLGVILEEKGSGGETSKDKTISRLVLGATIVVTVFACWWLSREINRVKPAVIYERRKARQEKMAELLYGTETASTVALNSGAFESDSELTLRETPSRPEKIPGAQKSGGYAGLPGDEGRVP